MKCSIPIDSAGISLTGKHEIMQEWNEAADAWADFVRTGKDYNRTGVNNPATFKLIGEIRGKRVLDLACGEGFNTRILARKGGEVTGVDFSEKLITYAKQEEAQEKLGIHYEAMDATNLNGLAGNQFDLVTCFMALQDIEDYEKAVAEVARVLKNCGHFIFSIPHPCFEKIPIGEKRAPAAENYFKTLEYHIDWNMKRLTKQFTTTSIHRTLTAYFHSLYLNKLLVRRLVEPRPDTESVKQHPYFKESLIRPQSIIIESLKMK
ncbi:MAG: methyltransferase domain-containing protein [Candidatus Bathyarchaeota archaeon]|nr:MAG: methyltransferase domain-containing protein [Candidatus Bathyarchaeota archaeon]